jgi:hypothetical protein
MKSKLIIIVILFAAVALYAGQQILDSFTAKSDGKVITLEWKSNDESSIKSYSLERSGAEQFYREISNMDAKGSNSYYRFVDEDAFLKGVVKADKIQNDNVYYYRLKIVSSNGAHNYSDKIYVTHNVSSIRRTWGMIKEMFR